MAKESSLNDKKPVDVRAVLAEGSPFGFDQVEQLKKALVNNQIFEVRQEVQQVEEKLRSNSQNQQLLVRAGIGAYVLGRHVDADDYLSKVSGDGVAEYIHAHVLISLERYADALKKLDSAEKHGADAVDCKLTKAGVVRILGKPQEAEALVHSSAPQGATRAEYSYQMGCLLSDRGDTYGAVEYFERAVDMDPYHSRALFSLAGENVLRGNDDEAVRLYERALSRPPFYIGAMMNLGLLYEDSENYSAAAYCFRRVLEANPAHARARLYLKDIDAASDMFYDEEILRNQSRLSQLMDTPVTDFELSVRSRNCLQKMGIRNLGDLTKISESELLASKNFGDTSLDEIKFMLESRGLKLGQSLMKDKGRDFGVRAENLSPQEQAMMSRPVADLNLSVRARKCMSRLGITTLGELTSRTQDELLESKNFGVTSLNEVRQKLTDLGLKLRND